MSNIKVGKLFLIAAITSTLATNAVAVDNPCEGLLNLVDRPSASDSACAVPFKQAVLEMGYQYQQVNQPRGQQSNLPNAEIRIGLPANNELGVLLPNYIHQNVTPHYGNSATTVALKHEIGYNEHWLGAVEAVVTLPQGSAAFGSDGVGANLNAIISYNFNPQYNLTLMFGGGSQTTPSLSGGQRYSSVNPDVVFTYSPSEKINLYAEVFGQSKTGPAEGSGFNADGGVLFLIKTNWEIDFEVGQRISGNLNSLNHYIGTGTAIQF
jgi:Putative MetA-pathway of phenol degradation